MLVSRKTRSDHGVRQNSCQASPTGPAVAAAAAASALTQTAVAAAAVCFALAAALLYAAVAAR